MFCKTIFVHNNSNAKQGHSQQQCTPLLLPIGGNSSCSTTGNLSIRGEGGATTVKSGWSTTERCQLLSIISGTRSKRRDTTVHTKQARKIQGRKIQGRKIQARTTQARKIQARKIQARKIQARKIRARKIQARKIQARKIQARKTQAREK